MKQYFCEKCNNCNSLRIIAMKYSFEKVNFKKQIILRLTQCKDLAQQNTETIIEKATKFVCGEEKSLKFGSLCFSFLIWEKQ